MNDDVMPLSADEEAMYREGLTDILPLSSPEPLSLLEITTREWAQRMRRLFATLDAERGVTLFDDGRERTPR